MICMLVVWKLSECFGILDGAKLCKCSKVLTVFHKFAYEVSKVAFCCCTVQTSRSKHIRRGWCVSDFLWKKIAVTNANFFASDLAVFLLYKESY